MREYPSGLHTTRHNTNLPSNLKNVALACETSVEKKERVSYISKNDPIPALSVFGSRLEIRRPVAFPLDPSQRHQKGDLSKKETTGLEIKLEHHLNSALNLVACVTGAG